MGVGHFANFLKAWLVIDKGYYKRKLTRFINDENAVRQASKAYASEGEDHNFF
ncbi:hypothetical protein H8356DRAFT_1321370 [Neocallimastix lanati (nom. inval.)]|nr:hypothetical protein H8356DRAFT_1321370 [Neocallimastix sp. JGI-2020a]